MVGPVYRKNRRLRPVTVDEYWPPADRNWPAIAPLPDRKPVEQPAAHDGTPYARSDVEVERLPVDTPARKLPHANTPRHSPGLGDHRPPAGGVVGVDGRVTPLRSSSEDLAPLPRERVNGVWR